MTLCLFAGFLAPGTLPAQDEVGWLKQQVGILAGPEMAGRGYVEEGGEKAADYIGSQFRELGIRPFGGERGQSGGGALTGMRQGGRAYFQPYAFPVNTFPGEVSLRLNRKELEPGRDFMVHGASRGITVSGKKVTTIDLSAVSDTLVWDSIRNGFSSDGAYLLRGIPQLMQLKKLTLRSLAREFSRGIFIIPMKGKLSWLVTTDTIPATMIYVADSVMPRKVRKMSAVIENRFVPVFLTQNVVGYVPGTEKPDSFIVFTAHYDHLGKMGKNAVFTGANDNASGTAMLLSMAKYYSRHPQKYSMAFMAFSGEEAGLVGSSYYVNYPLFPLRQIRFVLNMDMMGDGTKGITVVNAPSLPVQFGWMESINGDHKYLPAVISRGQTKNSDHYPFSQKGVDAVFIYTNGVKPYYHDIKDRPQEVDFENAPGVIKLLEEFVGKLQGS